MMATVHARGHCLLVVEDDSLTRETMAFILQEEGYTVAEAGNGLEAMEQLRQGFRPEVILLDLSMPAMNGWAFCIELQRNPVLAGTPVVVISGVTDPAPAAGFLHAAGSLRKPFNAGQLLAAVEHFCGASD